MNLLPGVSLVKIAVYAAIALAIFGAGGAATYKVMKPQLDKVTAEYNQFKGGVAAAAEASRQAAVAQALRDHKRKERLDAENAARADLDRNRIAGLRRDADSARSGFLSAVAGEARSAAEAAQFRSKFERAYRTLVDRLRAVGDDGDAAVRDLDTAKEFANP